MTANLQRIRHWASELGIQFQALAGLDIQGLVIKTGVVLSMRIPYRVLRVKWAVLFWNHKKGNDPNLDSYTLGVSSLRLVKTAAGAWLLRLPSESNPSKAKIALITFGLGFRARVQP